MGSRRTMTERKAGLLKLIDGIRNSHPDMERLYMEGRCYEFADILKGQYPGGEVVYAVVEGHIYYEWLDGKFYDIRGGHFKIPKPYEYVSTGRVNKPWHWHKSDKRRLSKN